MAEVAQLSSRYLRSKMPDFMERLGIVTVGKVVTSLDKACPAYHNGKGGHSPPGSPPYRETGNLMAGVDHIESQSGDTYSTEIVSKRAGGDAEIPFWLEFGTSKMAARPYMRPVRNQGSEIIRRQAENMGGASHATPY